MSARAVITRGSGGGKSGGGGGRVAKEVDDSLQSKQTARILDLLGEGEIEGLVNGVRSIYLESTPVQSADGTVNFPGVSYQICTGTQAQTYIPGFESQESEASVSVQVRAGVPVTRQITNTEVNSVRVTIGVPALTQQDIKNGDINGTSVEIAIDVQAFAGSYVEQNLGGAGLISGKTRSHYQRSYRVPLVGTGPWNVRVRRLTPDSGNSALNNDTFWDSYTEVTEVKLTYPNSAVIGLSGVDAQQFGSVPVRAYHVRLLRVRVPTNYEPVSRIYTGAWDGTFKIAYTSNPAWCFFDMMTSTRYGLGQHIPEALTDKWGLYQIGKYCDEMVPDGFGGLEPRFTMNVYLQVQEDAYKVIADLASVFRGMLYWAQGAIFAVQDSPTDPQAVFNATNVVDGTFYREGTGLKARHTVAVVTWNDPANFYRATPEYVEDAEGIARYGVRDTRVVAFGCTSQGQANRVGRWLLFTEKYESEVISFTAGLDSVYVRPGQIAEVVDPNRSVARWGGRVHAATATTVTIDAPVTLSAGIAYTLTVMMPDGTLVHRLLTNAAGETSALTFAADLPFIDITEAVWVLGSVNQEPELVRILAIAEDTPTTYKLTACQHYPGKFDAVELDLKLEARVTSDLLTAAKVILPPTLITFNEVSVADPTGARRHLDISWVPPANVRFLADYFFDYRIGTGNWLRMSVPTPEHRLLDVVPGVYSFRVFSHSIAGPTSAGALAGNYIVADEPLNELARVTGLEIFNQGNDTEWRGRDAKITWRGNSRTGSYEIGAEPHGADSGFLDPTFRDYRVRVYDATGNVLRTEVATDPRYTYTYEKNVEDGVHRDVTIGVCLRDTYNRVSREARLSISNPLPAPVTVSSLRASFKTIFFQYAQPVETDWDSILVWRGLTADFVANDASLVYRGRETLVALDAEPATAYYLKHAAADTFGLAGLVPSGALAVTTAQIGAVDIAEDTVRASHLFSELGARVNLIDGGAGLAGSVNARVAAETAARAIADAAESSARVLALTTEATTRTAAIAAEALTRANADTTELNARNDLAVQLRGGYTGADLAAVSSGLVFQERSARVSADSALATQVSLLFASVEGSFDPFRTWYFDGTVEGWVADGTAVVTYATGSAVVTSSGTTPGISQSSDFSTAVNGAQYRTVKLRVKRTAGSGWSGKLQYRTAGHGFSGSYYATAANPPIAIGAYAVVQWEMSTLTAGGTDWISSSIQNLRIELGVTSADVFEIDWIAVGRDAPAASIASVLSEEAARVAADTAEATARTLLSSKVLGATDPSTIADLAAVSAGIVFEERTARSSADTALASSVSTLSSTVTSNNTTVTSAITSEATTRASADTAISATVTSLTSTVGVNTAAIAAEASTRASADTAIAATVTSLTSTVGGNTSAISSEATTRASADSSLASGISALTSTVSTNDTAQTAAITSEATTRASADTAISATVTSLTSTVGVNTAAIAAEASTRASADTAIAATVTSLTSTVGANTAAIAAEATTRASADTAIAATVTSLTSTVGSNTSAISSEATTRASADSALASSVSTLSSTVSANNTAQTAAVTAEATTRASTDTGLLAQYTVKVDVNGYVAGYGLASTLVNNTPFSEFLVRADRFSIGASGSSTVVPFTVSGGVVYMRSAMIENGTIESAQINNLAADKVDVGGGGLSAITANLGSVTAGSMTLDTSGFIRAGQTAFNTGTGFWQGYSGGAYKLSFGIGGGARMTWDGTSLNIVGASLAVGTSFSVDAATGAVMIRSASTGARLEITNNVIRVYDAAGTLRVKLGDLA